MPGCRPPPECAPEIAFDSAANPLTLPDDIYLGEVGGVATNSKGDIFVYTRTGHPTVSLGSSRAFAHGGSRLFQFDRTGKFIREIGKDSYGFMFAQQVRIDPQDNIWIVDQMAGYVMKLDPTGRVQMLLGRKPEAIPVPAPRAAALADVPAPALRRRTRFPGAGAQSDVFNRPTDVAWDAAGNIFVADGIGNARVAKFDSKGVFVKSWGSKGTEPGLFGIGPRDCRRRARQRLRRRRRQQAHPGLRQQRHLQDAVHECRHAAALCITPGPNQVLYSSNSNPPEDIDVAGEIYKMKLDGTIVGKFGKAGKLPKEFGTVNAIDCRSENNLLVGEIGNMRVQKITLH